MEARMPSPFPGMNPFLEQNDSGEDFHASYLMHVREALSGQVGPNYVVKIEVRLLLHELSAAERRFVGRADVAVATLPANASSSSTAAAGSPVQLQLPAIEIERHASVEIRDRRNRKVVTVLELLSPSN